MQALLDQMVGRSSEMMNDPFRGLAPIKRNAMEANNRNYIGAGDRITTSLAKRGYAGSGKLPGAFVGLERGRLEGLGNIESVFAQMGLDREQQGADLGSRLLASQTGQTQTGTGPGNAAGAGLQAAGSSMGNLATLMMLQKMLKT